MKNGRKKIVDQTIVINMDALIDGKVKKCDTNLRSNYGDIARKNMMKNGQDKRERRLFLFSNDDEDADAECSKIQDARMGRRVRER